MGQNRIEDMTFSELEGSIENPWNIETHKNNHIIELISQMDPHYLFFAVLIAFHEINEYNETEAYPKHLNYSISLPFSPRFSTAFETNDTFSSTNEFSANFAGRGVGIAGVVYRISI